jgi:four helix bundle protein
MIYKMTEQFPQDGKFGTVSQIGRGSISIASNLAEGTSRSTGGGGG